MTIPIAPPLHWNPVPPIVPVTLRGRTVTLEPLSAEHHTAALWQAVQGHDDLWTWLFDGPFATEAALRQSIEQKETGTAAVFLAIVLAESTIPERAGALISKAPEGAGAFISSIPEGAGAFISKASEGAEAFISKASEGTEAFISKASEGAGAFISSIPEGAGAFISSIPEGAGAFMPLKEAENTRPSGPASYSSAKAAGYASFMRIEPAHGVVEVGNILLSPILQRTTAATEAMYLMARHIFDDLGYRRYEWKCNAQNQPSRRAAQRLGFTYEGIFRQHLVVKDRNRDTAWFSMLDTEWPARKQAFEAWLSPANFDDKGRQIKPLNCSANPSQSAV